MAECFVEVIGKVLYPRGIELPDSEHSEIAHYVQNWNFGRVYKTTPKGLMSATALR